MSTTLPKLDNIPAELRDRKQWVCWKLETDKHGGKRKVPKRPTRGNAKVDDPSTWSTFDEARVAAGRFSGMGFVFSPDEPYIGIDLDDCRDAATGVIKPWAMEFVELLDTYVEVSPSGTGLHLIAKGESPCKGTGERVAYETGKVETYTHGRYFCTTGNVLGSQPMPVAERTPQIATMWAKVRGKSTAAVVEPKSNIEACREALAKLPEAVAGDKGHDKTYRVGCEILRWGFDGDEGRALFDWFNENMCDPQWEPWELDHKWADALKAVMRGREFGVLSPKLGGFSLESIDYVDFMQEKLTHTYLVEGVVAKRQHLMMGGPKKVLKTSAALDLAKSLASGTPFLNYFKVPNRVRVMVISAESGRESIQATCNRIQTARKLKIDRGWFRLSFKRPQLSLPGHLAEVRREIEENKIEMLLLDPAYLLCKPAKGDTSNVFDMGDVLAGFGDIGDETGCTLAILHHSTKGARRTAPAMLDLDDLSGSGFAEWARQYILINRLAPMTPQFVHRLTMNVGGSARHHGQYELTIDEGSDSDPTIGPRWAVAVKPWEDARADAARAADDAKADRLGLDKSIVRTILLSHDFKPMSKSAIREDAGFNPTRLAGVLRSMVADGELEECDYFASNHKKPKPGGYRLVTTSMLGVVG